MAIPNNETLYDEKLEPLLRALREICDEAGIPAVFFLQIAPDLTVTTSLPREGQHQDADYVMAAIEHVNKACPCFAKGEGVHLAPLGVVVPNSKAGH